MAVMSSTERNAFEVVLVGQPGRPFASPNTCETLEAGPCATREEAAQIGERYREQRPDLMVDVYWGTALSDDSLAGRGRISPMTFPAKLSNFELVYRGE